MDDLKVLAVTARSNLMLVMGVDALIRDPDRWTQLMKDEDPTFTERVVVFCYGRRYACFFKSRARHSPGSGTLIGEWSKLCRDAAADSTHSAATFTRRTVACDGFDDVWAPDNIVMDVVIAPA